MTIENISLSISSNFQGRQLCHNCFSLPPEKGPTLKGKNLEFAPLGAISCL